MVTRFYINPEQDIISVIHRLLSLEARRVILNIPSQAKITQDAISLRILKREAQEMEKEVLIASNDPAVLRLAQEAGLGIYQQKSFSPDSSLSLKKLTQESTAGIDALKESSLVPTATEESSSFLDFLSGKRHKTNQRTRVGRFSFFRQRGRPRQKFSRISAGGRASPVNTLTEKQEDIPKRSLVPRGILKWLIGLFLVISCLVAGVVAYLILPQAKIEILPKQEVLNFGLEVLIDSAIAQLDIGTNKIPGQLMSVVYQSEQEFSASQEREVDSRASGKVRIYNNFNTSEQVLVATTRFIPEGTDLVYRIKEKVVVPAAKIENNQLAPSFVEAVIQADQVGEQYNINTATLRIPGFAGSAKYQGFYAQTLEPLSGGSQGRVKVVSEADINQAKDVLSSHLQETGYGDLTKQIPSHLKFLEQCQRRTLLNLNSSVAAGNPQEKFVVSGELKLEAMVFQEQDLRDLVEKNIVARISEQKHSLPQSQILDYLTCQLTTNNNTQRAQLSIQVQEKVAFNIDKDKFIQDIAGKDATSLERYFKEQPGIDKVRVRFWPFWVKTAPDNRQNLELKIVEALD